MSERVKAVISLTLICLFVSVAVTFSYEITKPYIERSANQAAYEAMELVLPETKKFEKINLPQEILQTYNCTFIRKSVDNNAVAMQVEVKGYQSGLVVMVGINANGTVSGVRIVKHLETEGIGTRAMTEEYLSNYIGRENTSSIQLISGATYTSEGIKNAVKNAFSLFAEIKRS